MSKILDEQIFNLFVDCQSGKMTCRLASEKVEAVLAARLQWIQGEPPLDKIVLIWNGKQMFGPISFHRSGDLSMWIDRVTDHHGGYPTHYLIVPKCE